mgnify:CR=1 FL=1
MANEYVNKVVLSSGETLIDLSGDTADAAHVLKGSTFHDKSGAPKTGTCEFDSDTSDDTVATAEILVGKTAHARGVKITGTMPNNGAVAGKITQKDGKYTIPMGFHDGSGSAAIGAYLTKKHGAPQCVSIRQPGGAIAVTTRCAEDGALSSLTISGTVLLGRSKKADVTL